MNEHRRDYIRHQLGKAREALEDAELPIHAMHFTTAVNRLYYACFYAATALLVSEGVSARKHTGLVSLFGEHWVRPGRLPREMGAFLNDMLSRRLQGDYGEPVIYDPDEVQTWLTEATRFLETIEGVLREKLGEQG